jgi:hypothetical protein
VAAETASDAAPEAIVSGSISTSFTVSVVRLLFLDPRTQMLRSSALVRKEKMRWGFVPQLRASFPARRSKLTWIWTRSRQVQP